MTEMSNTEADRTAAAQSGHEMGCFQTWADQFIEAGGEDDNEVLIGTYVAETQAGFGPGRKCGCVNRAMSSLAELNKLIEQLGTDKAIEALRKAIG